MQTVPRPKITDAEWEVMRVIWTNQPAASRLISKVLGEKMNWKPATVKTLIGRLVEKGFVTAEPEGNKYLYSALVTEEESMLDVTDQILSHVCDKKVGSTLAELIQAALLSKEDITLLEKVLENKKQTAMDEVPCNCMPGQCECQSEHLHLHP